MDREHFYATMNGEGNSGLRAVSEYQIASRVPEGLQGFMQWRRIAVSDRSSGRRALDEVDRLHASRY